MAAASLATIISDIGQGMANQTICNSLNYCAGAAAATTGGARTAGTGSGTSLISRVASVHLSVSDH